MILEAGLDLGTRMGTGLIWETLNIAIALQRRPGAAARPIDQHPGPDSASGKSQQSVPSRPFAPIGFLLSISATDGPPYRPVQVVVYF